jgi:ATP-dependent protease HslVU (ClpYQ) peptidase subunit
MTTIAFDGCTLAGDRQSTAGGTPTETRKVFEVLSPTGERWLYGCAGNAAQCQEFTRRVQAKMPMPTFTDFAVLAVGPDGSIWQAEENLIWERKGTIQWAAGSGANYALGAMAAGATAEEAVRVAMGLDVSTGLGVDFVRLR